MKSLEWLYQTQLFGMKLGLDTTKRLIDQGGVPGEGLTTCHVAGTNGKGSVCAYLRSLFSLAEGKTVGLFSSPHLVDFSERIQVNDRLIGEGELERLLEEIRATVEKWDPHPTFFEITLILALRHFAERGIETMVLETGMGGRLDSTNAWDPVTVSVLTPVDYDHSKWLGDTLEEIAGEKAGIFRPGVPVISAPQQPEVEAVFCRQAAQVGTTIRYIDSPYEGKLRLVGEHQRWNAALALEAFRLAGGEADPEAAAAALEATRWPGRFDRIGEGDRYIVDGAHNPHAVEALVATWRETFPGEVPTLIFGAVAFKDPEKMLDVLRGLAGSVILSPIESKRSLSLSELKGLAREGERVAESLESAVALAAENEGRILIAGSLFLAGEAYRVLEEEPWPGNQLLP
ncbi:MAG: cyanophycin synthetase [Verrucomicrobiota bacterium]